MTRILSKRGGGLSNDVLGVGTKEEMETIKTWLQVGVLAELILPLGLSDESKFM